MRQFKLLLCCTLATLWLSSADAQLLKKLKDKANEVLSAPSGNNNNNNSNGNSNNSNGSYSNGNSSSSNTGGSSRPSNKGGGGLITTPPEIDDNLATAETAFKSGSYGEARYAIQQAMLGVELQIGKQLLKSLPATISGLPKDTTADQVASTGWGWAGLTIHREYKSGDKQLRITLANNAVWMQAINMYFNNGFAQTSNSQQNWKQTKVKGNRAIIEYDDNTGYKLSVPLGQTSLLVYEGINFASEQDMMNAANALDIDGIKKQLGEK